MKNKDVALRARHTNDQLQEHLQDAQQACPSTCAKIALSLSSEQDKPLDDTDYLPFTSPSLVNLSQTDQRFIVLLALNAIVDRFLDRDLKSDTSPPETKETDDHG